MSLQKKIFILIHDYIGNSSTSAADIENVEIFLRNELGVVEYTKKIKLSIEKETELIDNHVNIEEIEILLEERKKDEIELDSEEVEELDNKKLIPQKETKKIDAIEPEKKEKVSEKEKIIPKQPEKTIEIKDIPLKLNIIEDPLEILTKFKTAISPRPYITADVAPRKNFFFVANLDDVNFFLYGKCKKCDGLIECGNCNIHKNKDGVRAVFLMYFLDGNPIKVVAFNQAITKYFKINHKKLIEITKSDKNTIRMKFLDLYRNRLLVFQAKFLDLKKTQECITNHIFCWKEKNIAKYFQKLEV